MSLTQSAERAALNKLIDYLDDNPQENIDKIMDLVNKLVPNRVFPVQREAFTNVIKSRGNWYDLIMRAFSLSTPTCLLGQSRKKPRKVPVQYSVGHPARSHERLQPALHGLLGRRVRLQAESLVRRHRLYCYAGQSSGYPHLHLHWWRAIGAQAGPHPNLREAPGLRFPVLYQLHADRRGLLRRHDSRR